MGPTSHTHTPHTITHSLTPSLSLGLSLSGDGFEGLQYQVGLVDQPVGTDEDIYGPVKGQRNIGEGQ